MVRYNGISMEVKPMKDQIVLMFRCVFGLIWGITFFYGEGLYKLGDFITICQTNPIFVAVLGAVILGKPFGMKDLISIFVCFGGVIFIMKPDFVFQYFRESPDIDHHGHDESFDLFKFLIFFGNPSILAGC
jgi:drug/metabolite transporter (DMT)-like permease